MGVRYSGTDLQRAALVATFADQLGLEFSIDRVNVGDDGASATYVVDVPVLADAPNVAEVPAAYADVRDSDDEPQVAVMFVDPRALNGRRRIEDVEVHQSGRDNGGQYL